MLIESAQPTQNLQAYFKEYYFLQLEAGDSRKTIPVIDDCSYDFVFYKECNATLTYGRPAANFEIKTDVFTIHQLQPPFTISFGDSLTFFTLKLNPWYNGHFFSGLSKPGIHTAVDFLPSASELSEIFSQTQDPSVLFQTADELLSTQPPSSSPGIDLSREICELIIAEKGMISVNQLSEHFGRSRQYLNKVFKKEVLYSLKKYITTVRILDLVKFRSKRPDLSLTELAYEYGYFDQAHFIHDFKNVCGVNPSYYFDNLPEFMLRH